MTHLFESSLRRIGVPGTAVLALLALALGAATAAAEDGACVSDAPAECLLADAEVAFLHGLRAVREDREAAAAVCFERALECRPDHGSARYWLAVLQLRAGQPRQAAEGIAASLDARQAPRADRWRILAHLGAARLAAGDEKTARQSFEAARKQLEEHRDATAEDALAMWLLGRALAETGRVSEGEEIVARARDLDPEVELRRETFALPRYRGAFWPLPGLWSWEGRLGISTGYDSNPNLLDDELVLRGLDGELIEGAESDGVQELGSRLAVYRLPGPAADGGAGGWSLGLTLEGDRTFHQDFDSVDLGQGLAAVHLAKGADPLSYLSGPLGYTRVPYGWSWFSLLLQAGYRHTRLGGDTYFEGAVAGLSLTLRESPATETRIEAGYLDFDFAGPALPDRDRSGDLRYLDVSQALYLKRRDRFLRFGLAAGKRDAGPAFERSFTETYAEAVVPIRPEWSLLLQGSLRRDDFDHLESQLFVPASDLDPGAEPREDEVWRTTATLVWSVRQSWKLLLSVGHDQRDSEVLLPGGVPGLDYERTSASLGVLWFFGSNR